MKRRKPRAYQACPVCSGEGRVFRMTPVFEAAAMAAAGQAFGWTGPTHEWRQCPACRGSGLLEVRA